VSTDVKNQDAAKVIFGVASLLDAQGANPYRVRAYRRAARALMLLRESADQYANREGELDLPWLGPRLRRKLGELVTTGRMQFQVDLIAELPPAMRELMSVPGIGPKTAQRLIRELELAHVDDVARAAQTHQLSQVKGIGPVRERQLGRAAESMLHAEAA
jgi:DNA polymerase (family 10)